MFHFLLSYMLGASLYPLIEVLTRGYTHWSMSLTGGLCFLSVFWVSQSLAVRPLWLQAAVCALLITLWELLCGLVVNRALGLGVWDYSALPFSFLGQICLPYTLVWFGLSFPALGLAHLVARM